MPKTTTEYYRYKTIVTPLERGDGSGPSDWERAYARKCSLKLPQDCYGLDFLHQRMLDDGSQEFTWFEREKERDKYAMQTDGGV